MYAFCEVDDIAWDVSTVCDIDRYTPSSGAADLRHRHLLRVAGRSDVSRPRPSQVAGCSPAASRIAEVLRLAHLPVSPAGARSSTVQLLEKEQGTVRRHRIFATLRTNHVNEGNLLGYLRL